MNQREFQKYILYANEFEGLLVQRGFNERDIF